ncbi:hypothetical protein DCC81_02955 [Chitinophaga parva]|uniref:DUF2752 domain-containing protein n=1 Tax=Chitinophaga parva TaxID=2169414 RepID=A0A2T7BLE2_9BACT|nr:DUF2752 domain-containing protein [Chitinophaga parva]PUZ28459.1 hypothetical protein DCC81_02955 [Chitinophaga parva]
MQPATIQRLRQINPELIIWPLALILLAVMPPAHPYPSICPLRWLGISWCPGCGLGRSVSYLLHGDFRASWASHKLGGPAFLILLHRTFSLALKTIKPSI